MNGYDGPSVGLDGELIRQQATQAHSRSSAWSNLRFERAVVKSFSKDGNIASVETEDGEIHSRIRVHTPLEWILFFYGEVEKLFNLPCLIIYRSIPEDGFVQLGDLAPLKEKDGSRSLSEPFYL